MSDKVKKYRKRRMSRLLKRMDAGGDSEGRWVTTRDKNKVHFNERGVPDKGNPYVISAMTGKKPKLSLRYKQKKAQDLLGKGKELDLDEIAVVIDSLPDGTVIKTQDVSVKREGDHFVDEKTGKEIVDGWDVGYMLKWKSGDKAVQFVGPEEESKEQESSPAPAPVQESETVSAINKWIDGYSKDKKNSSVKELYALFDKMEEGDSVQIHETVLTIEMDEYGDHVFKSPTGKSMSDMEVKTAIKMAVDAGATVKAVTGSRGGKAGGTAGGSKPQEKTTISDINGWIEEYAQSELNGTEEPDTYALSAMLDQMEDGDEIQIGTQVFEKSVDKYGGTEFHHEKLGTVSPFYIKTKIKDAVVDGIDVFALSGSGPTSAPVSQILSSGSSPEEQRKYVQTDPDDYDFSTRAAIAGASGSQVVHSVSDFTRERKDAAVWDTDNGKTADATLRPVTSAVWKGLEQASRHALWSYTDGSYRAMNTIMRGEQSSHLSEDETKEMQKKIDRVTAAIDQCEAPEDMWLQRGCSYHSFGKLFGISESDFDAVRDKGAKAIFDLISTSADYGQDKAFMSCGSSRGKGFTSKDVIMNIYCPKGTKMMYAEPFSDYGASGAGAKWDGESGQYVFSGEDETLLQRGTMMVPRKVSIKGGKIYVDVDVIGQDY